MPINKTYKKKPNTKCIHIGYENVFFRILLNYGLGFDIMQKRVTTVRLSDELYDKIQKSNMKNSELFTKAVEYYLYEKNTL